MVTSCWFKPQLDEQFIVYNRANQTSPSLHTHPVPVKAKSEAVQLLPHGLDITEATQSGNVKHGAGWTLVGRNWSLHLPLSPLLWIEASLDGCIFRWKPKSVPTHWIQHLHIRKEVWITHTERFTYEYLTFFFVLLWWDCGHDRIHKIEAFLNFPSPSVVCQIIYDNEFLLWSQFHYTLYDG